MPRGKKEKKSKKEKKPKNEKKPKKGKRVKATDQPADIAEQVVLENARSVANRELPPAPPSAYTPDLNGILPVTLVLFYQYVEPVWTAKQHKKFLSFVISLGGEHNITGRGRCAPEGLNCTLMGTPSGVRDFCMGLRTANPLFNETDFKLTDGVDPAKKFKALTIRKVDELVAYGLEGEKAPSLKDNTTKHVEAIDYHRMMEDKDTVIIDVRNAYESAIGHFNPPPGGAELIDPKMRNSKEFPKWLNAPETQEKLNGKKVMMYCTGGIRCERASALLDSMTKANPEFKTQGVSMIRGGVERYMRTFPEGGYWKGSNFLFDRRFEQIPEAKPAEKLAEEIESCCCVCWKPWNQYRGQYACHLLSCKVPVLVCSDCHEQGAVKDVKLRCPLCIEGFQLRHLPAPDLKRARPAGEAGSSDGGRAAKKSKAFKDVEPSQRIFVGKLPLTVDTTSISAALAGGVKLLQWITDKKTGYFYGSAFVEMQTLEQAQGCVSRAAAEGIKISGKRLRVNFAPPPAGEAWPTTDFQQQERPPIPV